MLSSSPLSASLGFAFPELIQMSMLMLKRAVQACEGQTYSSNARVLKSNSKVRSQKPLSLVQFEYAGVRRTS